MYQSKWCQVLRVELRHPDYRDPQPHTAECKFFRLGVDILLIVVVRMLVMWSEAVQVMTDFCFSVKMVLVPFLSNEITGL